MIPFSSVVPVHAFALAALLLFAVPAVCGFALALWRRWLGGWGGDFPRSVKIAALAAFLGGLYLLGAWPVLDPAAWWEHGLADAWTGWVVAAFAWVGLACVTTLPALWFVVAHNNGGPEGQGGPQRYGLAGYGYPLGWRFRSLIPEVRLFGAPLIAAGGWTEVGELWLGGVTGLVIGAPLGIAAAYRAFLLFSSTLAF